MNNIFKILLSINLFYSGITIAQEIISSGGDYLENSFGSLSSTLCEPINETFAGTQNVITQGFQQSKFTIVMVYQIPDLQYSITASPNPVRDYVKLTVISDQKFKFRYDIYDNKGNLVRREQFEEEETTISVSGLIPSTYYL